MISNTYKITKNIFWNQDGWFLSIEVHVRFLFLSKLFKIFPWRTFEPLCSSLLNVRMPMEYSSHLLPWSTSSVSAMSSCPDVYSVSRNSIWLRCKMAASIQCITFLSCSVRYNAKLLCNVFKKYINQNCLVMKTNKN